MITLTLKVGDHRRVLINPAHVTHCFESGQGGTTVVIVGGKTLVVVERFSEVFRAIRAWV